MQSLGLIAQGVGFKVHGSNLNVAGPRGLGERSEAVHVRAIHNCPRFKQEQNTGGVPLLRECECECVSV